MKTVFISYRRSDSQWATRRINESLQRFLPTENIFMDVDSVAPGVNFLDVVSTEIAKCDVLLVVIGPEWIEEIDPKTGKNRLFNPGDYVRNEISTALERNIPVVPILIDGTEMPGTKDLPKELHELSQRNASFLTDRNFDLDIDSLAKKLGMSKLPVKQGGRWKAIAGAMALGVVAVSIVAFLILGNKEVPVNKSTYTEEEHVVSINALKAHWIDQLKTASDSEKPGIERKIHDIEGELLDATGSYLNTIRENETTKTVLVILDKDVSKVKLREAIRAIDDGDTGLADLVFEEIVFENVERAAEASYHRGRIARQNIEYEDAFMHFSHAAQLAPENWGYQIQAGLMALDLLKMSEARQHFDSAYELALKSEGDGKNLKLANSLGYLARIDHVSKDSMNAELKYLESLGLLGWSEDFECNGPARAVTDDPSTDVEINGQLAIAANLNNLALIYKEENRELEAESMLFCSVQIKERLSEADERVDGADSVQIATNRMNLGGIYLKHDKLEQAKKQLELALKTMREKQPQHPTTAVNMLYLAETLQKQGEYLPAETLLNEGLDIMKSAYPNEPSVTGEYYLRLGNNYLERGEYTDTTKQYFEDAVRISIDGLGKGHPDTARGRLGLAKLYKIQEKVALAKATAEDAVTELRSRELVDEKWADEPLSLELEAEIKTFLDQFQEE